MLELNIDFETRSDVNINAEGDNYFLSEQTSVYCMGLAFGDEPVEMWLPADPFPQRVIDHINAGGKLNAWNARFERWIFWYVLCNDRPEVPVPHMDQFQCTAARARAHGLPGKLAHCAQAMGLPLQKMSEGNRLIREYCAKNVLWEDIPAEDQALMIDYCATDVGVERQIGTFLRDLTEDEQYEYMVNEYVNDRGVPVDVPMATAAMEYATEIQDDVDEKVRALTGGKVRNAKQRKNRDEWVIPQLNEEQVRAITNRKKKKITFEKTRREALAVMPGVPQPVMDYLQLMEEAGGATVSKYKAMSQRHVDGRLTGALIWNGAGQTGRYSSMGLQLHNLRRDSFDDPEPIIASLKALEVLDAPSTTLARLVRSAIYSPQGLSWYDYSGIESRVAPWLSECSAGEKKLQLFRDGVDPYIVNAMGTYHVEYDAVTKEMRQIGKVQELSMQFLGGAGALISMGRNYGMHFNEHEAETLKDGWRATNPWAMDFGKRLNVAAIRAMRDVGTWKKAGRIYFAYDGQDWLWMKLPSGRLLAYYLPRLEWVDTPWDEQVLAVTCLWGAGRPKVGEEWPRRTLYTGLWIENATQAAAADLLREAIIRVDDAGLDIVLHVHDEIIVEGFHVEQLGKLMLDSPLWAAGLPVTGGGDSGTRYGK